MTTKIAPAAVFAVLVVGLWQVVTVVTDADPRIYPAPSDIVAVLISDAGVLARNAATTALEMLLGFVVGGLIGFLLGVWIGTSQLVRSALYPWLVISQTIPIPAVATVLVIWFGFGVLPKVVVVALLVFFPVAVATADGVRRADQGMVRLLRTLGASRSRILREVRIPSALPAIFTGLRVGAALSVLGAVFGEWVGARSGLGYLLLLENRAVNTDAVFAIIFLLSLLGILFVGSVALVERTVTPWRRSGTA